MTTLSAVQFTEIGKTAEFTWRGAVLDLAVAAVLLAITTSLLGWWRPALFERKRSHHKWPIFVPAGIAAMSGTCFYIVRRVTGSLVWAMALHGIWDVATFSVGYASIGVPWGHS